MRLFEELEKYGALQETLHEIESPLSHAASMKRGGRRRLIHPISTQEVLL